MNQNKKKNQKTIKKKSRIISKKILAKKRKVSVVKKKKSRKILKKKSPLNLKKPLKKTLLSPQKENQWESRQTFNPGVIDIGDKTHLLYRAIGEDGLSRFGHAISRDGLTISERSSHPVYEHRLAKPTYNFYSYASGGSFGGGEDARLVRVDNGDTIYMTYTACDEGLRVALTSITAQDFKNKKWRWKNPQLISPPDEVHKNWVIFPNKINGKFAILHSLSPTIGITYCDTLDFKEDEYIHSYYGESNNDCLWESRIRGIGPPPIKTRAGWLVLYHAMDKNDPGKYKIGAMLLDINDPTKILCRSPYPILEPDQNYENDGFKPGIVYASGAVVKNNKLFVYYGGADSHVCVALVDFEKFVGELEKQTATQN